MRLFKDYLTLALISGIVVALDQWTKYFVRLNLAPGERWVPWEWLAPYAPRGAYPVDCSMPLWDSASASLRLLRS